MYKDNYFNIFTAVCRVVQPAFLIVELFIGLEKPIYKGKGDRSHPENYRPVTLLSCLGKLFTSILCDRLNTFADEFEFINEAQTGFRKGYCTPYNIYICH